MLPSLFKTSMNPSISRFFDDDWNSFFDWSNRNFSDTETTIPSVNIQEKENEFIVEMAAPGMKKNDFQIELNNNVLSIRSELQNELKNKDESNYTRKEFSYQSFQRSFNLNNRVVDDAKIKAKYENGILYITIPKKEEAKEKPIRTINIS